MSLVIAFDADVLIYAASIEHPLGRRIAPLLDADVGRVGSVMLVNELLVKPLREAEQSLAAAALMRVLGRIELLPYTAVTARAALKIGVSYGLRTADAVHVATAVEADADVFLTNNKKEFPQHIREIEIVYPQDL